MDFSGISYLLLKDKIKDLLKVKSDYEISEAYAEYWATILNSCFISFDILEDKEDYEKYMTHQPYEDCQSLEIDKVLSWEVGSLLYWNRTRIHSSDNFFKSNVISKTAIVLFTSKNKI